MTESQKQTEINWTNEADNLRVGGTSEWFKPTQGQHTVVFLSNGEPFESEYEGEIRHRVRFDIETNSKKLSWGVTRGETQASLFGQIALIARASNGNLVGKVITLVVKGQSKSTQYTILEALPLMQKEDSSESSKGIFTVKKEDVQKEKEVGFASGVPLANR